ncbi:VOC family protein [Ottowia sp.]|uniref:VOC family protein n=1 Tax=Ottowia sp. TaxID=1898956 RepID=UPI0039E35E19
MEPRLSLVTLGVADVARATAFYTQLGFTRASASNDDVTFMKAGGVVLSLFGRRPLAEDAGLPPGTPGVDASAGFGGITLAHNVRSEAEVDAVLVQAVAAGAQLRKPGQKVFWGGYSGYFADPDGHLWEVAHNPFFPLDDQGLVQIDEG